MHFLLPRVFFWSLLLLLKAGNGTNILNALKTGMRARELARVEESLRSVRVLQFEDWFGAGEISLLQFNQKDLSCVQYEILHSEENTELNFI